MTSLAQWLEITRQRGYDLTQWQKAIERNKALGTTETDKGLIDMKEKLEFAVKALVTAQTAQAEANIKMAEAATILLNLATMAEQDKATPEKGADETAPEEAAEADKKPAAKKPAPKKEPKKEVEPEPETEPETEETETTEEKPLTLLDLQALVMKVMKEHDKETGKQLIAQYTSDGTASLKMVTKENFEALKEAAEDLL